MIEEDPMDPATRHLLDRAEIHDLMVRYAVAIDQYDEDAIAACFVPDAWSEYGGTVLGHGVGRILNHIRPIQQFHATSHYVVSVLAEVDGNTARGETYCISHLVGHDDDADHVRTRGIRYLDKLVRTQDGWRISRRVHEPVWTADPGWPSYPGI